LHEFSVMQSVVDAVLDAARSKAASKVLLVKLRVGELTFLNPEQLKFAFEVLTQGTIAEGAELIIERVKPKVKCIKCSYEGEIVYEGEEIHIPLAPLIIRCPKCGSYEVSLLAGRECTLSSIRVEVPRLKER